MNTFYDKIHFILFALNRVDRAFPLPAKAIPYMDLTYVIEGELAYRCNGKMCVVTSGDAILFPPGAVRERFAGDAPVCYASFNLQLPDDFHVPVCGVIENALRPNTVYFLETVKKDFASADSHKMEKCISSFFYLYFQLMETALDKENPHVQKIKRYINGSELWLWYTENCRHPCKA